MPNNSYWVLLFPGFLDCVSNVLLCTSLTLIDASDYQMGIGSCVVFTFLLSMLFLKRMYNWHNWLGVFLLFAGVTIVGLADILRPNTGQTWKSALIGFVLIILAMMIIAGQIVYEEYLFKNYYLETLKAAGIVGLWSTLITGILIIFLHFVPLPNGIIK